jgi:hypothetical protein
MSPAIPLPPAFRDLYRRRLTALTDPSMGEVMPHAEPSWVPPLGLQPLGDATVAGTRAGVMLAK